MANGSQVSSYRAVQLYCSGGEVLPINSSVINTTSKQPINSKLRVLFINHFPPRSNGSGTYTVAMAQHINRHGGDARILFLGTQLDDNIDVYQYLVPFTGVEGVALAGAATGRVPIIESNAINPGGIKIRDLPEQDMKHYIQTLIDSVNVAARHMQANVIVANHTLLSGEAARLTGLPYIVVCHGTCLHHVQEVQANPEQYAPSLLSNVLSGVTHAHSVLAVTSESKQEIKQNYKIVDEKVFVIPHGFDRTVFKPEPGLDKYKVLQSLGIFDQEVHEIIAYAGRITPLKGIDYLLDAARQIIEQREGVHFVIAGAGSGLDFYKASAKELGIDSRVHFIGHRYPQEVAELNNIANVCVLPTLQELFGISILEALGTGTPVVASAVGGLKDVVTPDLGALVPPKDSVALAQAIVATLDERVKELHGLEISKTVHACYSWDLTAARLMARLKAIKDDLK